MFTARVCTVQQEAQMMKEEEAEMEALMMTRAT
jgi:hypothetical protein